MMESSQITVCDKHKKKQTNLSNLPAHYFLCMNRYCPNSFTVLCQACKPEHRDHTLKILSIEDTCFLLDRLLHSPFKQLNRLMSESIEMMRKFKLIKEFKKKIDKLETEIHKEVISLLDITENLIEEFVQCKKAACSSFEKLSEISNPKIFKQFKQISKQCLAKVDYNFAKDRLQYGSLLIKELQDQRRKTVSLSKHKIEEVKDYSMKIIEVILNAEDSDEEEEQVPLHKKIYESLKEELFLFDSQIYQKEDLNEGLTKSTLEISKQNKKDAEAQTNNEWMKVQEKKIKELMNQVTRIEDLSGKRQTELRNKIAIKQRQKQKLIKEKQKEKEQYENKKKSLTEYEKELRENRGKRILKEIERKELMQKMYDVLETNQNK